MGYEHRQAPSGPVGTDKFTVTADHGSITAATVATATAAVTGVTTYDQVAVMPQGTAVKTNLIMGGGNCVTAGEILIYVGNPTAGAITTGTVTYTVTVQKFRK